VSSLGQHHQPAASSCIRLKLVFSLRSRQESIKGCPQASRSVLGAWETQPLWSIVGGAVGLAVDQAYCERHHGKEPSFPLGPCFLYANEGFGVGWFGGAVLGATLGAVKVAQKRGCPRKAAIIRAALGAALGIAPGVAIAAPRAGKYPPSRAMFIAGAPLLAGIGGAVAVQGCHAP